jgi:iron(II)-dependent oxidoreductase
VEIAAGCFQLGPRRAYHVLVPREACLLAYRVDRHEVTVAEYQRCVAAGVCQAPPASHRLCNSNRPDHGQHPMNCVTYEDAAGYCGWRGARLPSPDEWERAARGPRSTTYPWGEAAPTPRLAVGPRGAEEMARDVTTAPVCSTPRGNSAEGACDLAGNVAEWVAGYWTDSGLWPTAKEPAAGEARPGARMTRGGSFGAGRDNLQGWQRQRQAAEAGPNIRNGFRCVEDVVSR